MKIPHQHPIEIYRNLNRKGLWFSIRDKQTGLVADRIDLKQKHRAVVHKAKFNVSQAGRARVLREKRKNVHALIRGEFYDIEKYQFADMKRTLVFLGYACLRVSYDPYKSGKFCGHHNGREYDLTEADYVTLDERGVLAWCSPNTLTKMNLKYKADGSTLEII